MCKKRLRLDDDNAEAVACVADSTNSDDNDKAEVVARAADSTNSDDDDTRMPVDYDVTFINRFANKSVTAISKIFDEQATKLIGPIAPKSQKLHVVDEINRDLAISELESISNVFRMKTNTLLHEHADRVLKAAKPLRVNHVRFNIDESANTNQ